MALLPMGFKVRVDSSLPKLFCRLCAIIPRVISGCQERASNPERSCIYVHVFETRSVMDLEHSFVDFRAFVKNVAQF